LKINLKKGLKVMLASKDFVKGEGGYNELKLIVEGKKIQITTYVVKLGSNEVILRVH
jgi:hypothetical protein